MKAPSADTGQRSARVAAQAVGHEPFARQVRVGLVVRGARQIDLPVEQLHSGEPFSARTTTVASPSKYQAPCSSGDSEPPPP